MLMQELDLPTRESLRFIGPLLPRAGARILEVGCGDGRMAAELQRLGFSVVAVDRSAAAVQATRARGVEAIEADFLDLAGLAFDVVLFTRSLHHIHPQVAAIEQAHRLLRSPGLMIADEFAWNRMDVATARWFYSLKGILGACGALAPDAVVVTDGDELSRWLEYHRHTPPLASSEEMLQGAAKRFEVVAQAPTSYLYRYFHHWLTTQPFADPVAAQILAMEEQGIESRFLAPIGLQFVACQ